MMSARYRAIVAPQRKIHKAGGYRCSSLEIGIIVSSNAVYLWDINDSNFIECCWMVDYVS